MLRALPAVVFAFFPALALAQTQQPAPDTKPARERHRLQEKEPPPPQGPWGPEEFGLTWNPPAWRGAFVEVGSYTGASLVMRVPNGVASRSDGINPPVFERLDYHSESFRSLSIGATADLDSFRLSGNWFDGTFDARTTLTYDDGFGSPQSRDLDIRGKVYGFRLGAYWPALRYRDSFMEASFGLAATVGWMHEEDYVPAGVLLHRDTLDILTGSFGPRLSLRAFVFDRLAIEVNGDYSFLTGSVRGWTKEVTIGLGYKF